MLKLLELVLSLFSHADISGCVPPSLLFQHGHGYDRTGKQKKSRDVKQLPRLARTGVARLGAGHPCLQARCMYVAGCFSV